MKGDSLDRQFALNLALVDARLSNSAKNLVIRPESKGVRK